MSNSMQHWNGNQLCAIDTETTGLEPGWHEIIQICILPLDSNITPRKDVPPFYMMIKPDNPERADIKAMSVNRLKFAEIGVRGFDKNHAIDMLEDWISKLGLPLNKYGNPKKIVPLGQNYSFDYGHIIYWLGKSFYDSFFDYHYKDTMISANFLNDRAAMHSEKVPYSKVKLEWLAHQHNVNVERGHDALQDCLTTAAVYKEMITQGLLG